MHTGSLLPSLARNTRFATMFLSMIAALLGLAVSQAGAEPPTDGIGVITAVHGQVTMVHPQAESPVPAQVDTDVLFRDIIETQDESRTKALFDDETLLTVGEHSRVEITEHIYDPSQNRRSMVVKLARGTLRALISKVFDGSGSKFEIHTPTAVAAARGTYFVVWVQGELSGVVNIGAAGRVDFTSAGQTVSLAPGQFSVAPSGVIPTPPAVFGSSVAPTPSGQSSPSPAQSDSAAGRSGNTPGQSGLTPGQGAPLPGQVGATPGQSGPAPGKSGTAQGQGLQAWIMQIVNQDASFLASVRKAIERTELKDIPRPEKASTAVFANGGPGQGDRQSPGRDLTGGQGRDSGRKKGGSGSGKQAGVSKGLGDSSGNPAGGSGSGNSSSGGSGSGSQGMGAGVTASTPPGQGGSPPGQTTTPPAVISGSSQSLGSGGNKPGQGLGIGVTGSIPPGQGGTHPGQSNSQGIGSGVTGGTPPGLGGTPPGQSIIQAIIQGLGIGVTGGTRPGQGGTSPGQSNGQGIGIGVTGGTPPGLGGIPPGQGKK